MSDELNAIDVRPTMGETKSPEVGRFRSILISGAIKGVQSMRQSLQFADNKTGYPLNVIDDLVIAEQELVQDILWLRENPDANPEKFFVCHLSDGTRELLVTSNGQTVSLSLSPEKARLLAELLTHDTPAEKGPVTSHIQ